MDNAANNTTRPAATPRKVKRITKADLKAENAKLRAANKDLLKEVAFFRHHLDGMAWYAQFSEAEIEASIFNNARGFLSFPRAAKDVLKCAEVSRALALSQRALDAVEA